MNVLALVGDLASKIGKSINAQLRQPFIESLIIALRNQEDPECKEIAEYAFQQIKKAIS